MRRLRRISDPIFWLTGLAVLAVYLLTGSSDLKNNGDTDLRYQTAQAIVDHHRLWLSNPLWRDTRVATGIGGHLYAYYAPGQSLLMLPLYLLGKFIAHHLSLPYDLTTLYACRSVDLWLGVATALLLYWFGRHLGFSGVTSSLLTLLFAFATPLWPDAQSALDETQVTFFLFLAVVMMWKWSGRSRNRSFWSAAAGVAVGLAIFTRYDSLIYAPIFAGYVALQASRSSNATHALRQVLTFAAGIAPPLLGVAAWNQARFGSPFLTGLHEATFWENPWDGLLGLLVSPGKGLLWYMPLVILLPLCLRRFRRNAGPTGYLMLAVCIVTLAFYSNVLFWHGDPAWGPRYLYVTLPYVVLPLGELIERWNLQKRGARTAFVAVALASLAVQVAAISVTQWRAWYRLEAIQQQSANVNSWSGQPFRWGSSHYHYYWNLRQSPILLQFDDVYQVTRLIAGAATYRLTTQPDPYVASNTAANYPVNTFAFWWVDPLHPLLGQRTRAALALGLLLAAIIAFGLLVRELMRSSKRSTATPRVDIGWLSATGSGP